MNGLETAIRQALERSDRMSAETRARIYQSARNALEAGLRKQNVHDETIIAQQRHRLEQTIHAIEQQEREALRAQASVDSPVAAPLPPARPIHDPAAFDDVRMDARGDAGARHASAHAADSGLDDLRVDRGGPDAVSSEPVVAPVRDAGRPGAKARDAVNDFGLPGAEPLVPRRRRGRGGRFLSMLMVIAVLVGGIGSAAWWVVSAGLLEGRQAPASTPATTAADDFDGGAGLRTLGAQAGFTGDWLDVYTPAAQAAVSPAARARIETVRDEGGERLRITSSSGDAQGNVAIEVPAAVLARMSGQTSTLALSVQASSGKPTQFSVECDFASLGDCGRHRFTVNDEKSDMLFKVTFDRTLSPSGPGRILVNSDVTGSGTPLDLYAVRLLPGQ